ncbi:hypothetical protein EZ456_22775 [Pedobacter psychrodurus]|uniref:Outer membrane protein beta-barrel domain-containing protein n=1 Tax=Pedobacter psychrodurus TaxID=2530456 RepID=A0A4R0PJ39_9SPHI|nr:hypothetical protein [Pedobacter psychrodurus]TCD17644.1 hypothetical protein EZ456_22775 [Pedobacter psychrodurus]
MKKILFCSALVYASLNLCAQSQIKYTGKIETGYHIFLARPLKIDAGEGWMGYQLVGTPNGLDLSLVNGVSFKDNLRLGLGVSYLNYGGINGYSVFGDLEYVTIKARIAPVFNLKIGSSHINNQYGDGSTETVVDFSGGVEHRVGKKLSLQYKAGFRFVHQSIFLPIRIGARF